MVQPSGTIDGIQRHAADAEAVGAMRLVLAVVLLAASAGAQTFTGHSGWSFDDTLQTATDVLVGDIVNGTGIDDGSQVTVKATLRVVRALSGATPAGAELPLQWQYRRCRSKVRLAPPKSRWFEVCGFSARTPKPSWNRCKPAACCRRWAGITCRPATLRAITPATRRFSIRSRARSRRSWRTWRHATPPISGRTRRSRRFAASWRRGCRRACAIRR